MSTSSSAITATTTTIPPPPYSITSTTNSIQKSFAQKIGDCFKNMFLCCTGAQDIDDDHEGGDTARSRGRAGMQISSPTNFRREEINIPGMTPSQERFIREKARTDAERMFSKLRPLASSPSSQFAERPSQQQQPQMTATMPTYEQFVRPRAAPSPSPTAVIQQYGRLDRMMAHTRKISGGFRGKILPAGEVEMRALMDPSRTHVATAVMGENSPVLGGKVSGESWESRDSAKAGLGGKL